MMRMRTHSLNYSPYREMIYLIIIGTGGCGYTEDKAYRPNKFKVDELAS